MVFLSSAVNRGLEPQSGQIKDYEIGICCFSAKYINGALRRKNKDWFARSLGTRIMCPSGAACLSADCYFSELALLKTNYWDTIKEDLFEVLLEIFDKFEICDSQSRGMLTLLHK